MADKKFNLKEILLWFCVFMNVIIIPVLVYLLVTNLTAIPSKEISNDAELDLTFLAKQSVSIIDGTSDLSSSGEIIGSGFVYEVWEDKSIIVTAQHVVDELDNIVVEDYAGNKFNSELLFTDDFNDIAVLSIDEIHLSPVKLKDGEAFIGEKVYAVGSPFSFSNSISEGIISAKNRDVSNATFGSDNSFSLYNVLQTDAAINPGSSGGPLFDKDGELIGMISAIWSETNSYSGIGFVLPTPAVKDTISQLLESGVAEHNYIGLSGYPKETDKGTEGILVQEIVKGGPAEGIIQLNDIIVSANGYKTETMGSLLTQIQATPMDTKIEFIVKRDGKNITVKVPIKRRKY